MAYEKLMTVSVLRCGNCGAFDPGPRELCPVCHSADLEPAEVEGRGSLVSFTVIRRPPTRFQEDGAYAVAVVDLDAGPRITGRLPGIESEWPVGTPMKAVSLTNGYVVFARAEP